MTTGRLTVDDVDALVVGLTLLGSGGGGDAHAFRHVLRRTLAGTELVLHDPAALAEAPVVAIGMIGATRVLTEKLPSGQEIAGAVGALARWTGVEPTALMSFEAAGLNGAIAVAGAAELGLPLVDADLMGRALTRVDQLSFAVADRPLPPFAMAEPSGQTVLVDDVAPGALERVARTAVAHGGGWAACALGPVPASLAATDACTGTLARALRLGRAHEGLVRPEPEEVAAALGGRVLATGRTVEIARHPSASFGRAGVAILDDGGAVLRVEAENEYLLAILDGEPVASCPDLLCLLDRRTAAPIAVDGLRLGDDVVAIVLPGPPWWRASPERLRRVDPRAFGIDCHAVLLPDPVGDLP
ncbi:DUF917 domain-containing protein [Pseudonocardia sp. MH-G8]|uniref:DUF917 domain-containing protein n=1 Tax=Pseudonocardia sp. MH-G8 TaxID=1854588 RepID=UPI000BA07E54|nr:DUF917 domain-containing protein [Pseudonocardia sp. MH-G8]OZM75576.1 hypothetical protein CFP66_45730 [Pseudonocardia sp. MH-G8]